MLEASVRSRFATMCQKKSTRCGPLPAKREPKTTSARPSRTGPRRRGISCGSYSRSASWITTHSPEAAAIPVCSAAPFPEFRSCSRNRSIRPLRARRSRIVRVVSFEPSSTTISSIGTPISAPRTRSTIVSIVASSLYAGITTLSRPRCIDGIARRGLPREPLPFRPAYRSDRPGPRGVVRPATRTLLGEPCAS